MNYRPDPAFIKNLKEIDADLDVRWDRRKHRWQLWHKDRRNRRYLIAPVQNDDGSYRPLDGRTLGYLRMADAWSRDQRRFIEDIEEAEKTADTKLERDNYNDLVDKLSYYRKLFARDLAWQGAKNTKSYWQGANLRSDVD